MSRSHHLLHILAALCFGFSPDVVLSADVDAQRDLLRRMMRVQEVGFTEPIVTYCRSSAPESAKALDAGYANYVALMETARESWIRRLSDAELAGAPTAEDLREISAKMQEVSSQLLTSVRTRDPHKYCPHLAERLRAYTPEAAAKSIADAQAKINAARDRLKR